MNKKITILFVFALVAIFNIGQVASYPEGADPGYTSAPGESNCTSCHLGTAVNPANGGSAAISITGNPAGYTPGQTYEVNVTVGYTGRTRFGFALSAKKAAGGSTGTLSTNGNTKVKLGSGSNYITHTLTGTTGNTDSKTWKFNWTAPATSTGTTTFYASGMASNNNGNEAGDYVYTTSLAFPSLTTGIAEAATEGAISIYPNPVNESLNIRLNSTVDAGTTICIIDMSGKEHALGELMFHKGDNAVSISLDGTGMKGICFVKLSSKDGVVIKKIFIN